MGEEYKVEIIEIDSYPESEVEIPIPGGSIIKNFYAEHIKTINEKLGSIRDYHLINTNVVYNKDKTFVYLFFKKKSPPAPAGSEFTGFDNLDGGGKKNKKSRKNKKSKNSRKAKKSKNSRKNRKN